MKIIAERSGRGRKVFLLEADEDEVARLVGWYSHYQKPEAAPMLAPGQEVKVSEMYQRLHDLECVKFKNMARELRGIADALESKDPIIAAEECEAAE